MNTSGAHWGGMGRRFLATGAALAATLTLGSACCSAGRASPPDPSGPSGPKDPGAARAAEVEARVRALLSGYELVPKAEDWDKVGSAEEVSAALMAIAGKPEGQTVTAARALSSLGRYARPEVAAFLEARVIDVQWPAALRGKAALALAVAFADTKADVVATLFSSPDEALREDGVRAFRKLGSGAAERFLEVRMKVEPSPRLRDAMAEAAKVIGATRARGGVPERGPLKDPGPIRR